MRLTRAVLVSIVMLMMTMPAISCQASADGMHLTHSDIYDQWGLSREDTQYGVIGFHDGVQTMIISIKILSGDIANADKAVWLFPIPSTPSNANIGIVDQVGELNGKRMASAAQDSLTNDALLLSATQFYPLVFWFPIVMTSGYGGNTKNTLGGDGSYDVEVVQSIARFGVTTELIGTNSSAGLTTYLQDKGLDLPSGTVPIVNEYVGKDYSFVASWISNMTEFQSTAPREIDYQHYTSFYHLGVMVSFPTEKIFYPLRLTSVYDSITVPMVVQVVGLVNPIRSSSSFHGHGMTTDYLETSVYVPWTIAKIYDPDVRPGAGASVSIMNVKYTEIIINTTSSSFTDDLWIDPSPSLQARALDLAIDHSWAVSVPLFLLASMLASMVSGIVVYRGFQPKVGMFALFGLFNLLTIVGVWVAASRLDIGRRFTRKGTYAWPEVSSYLAAFTVLFMTFAVVAFGLFIGLLAL